MTPSSRLLAAQEARQHAQKRPLFLDTETTGLDNRAEIVEIAILDSDGLTLLESLVRPTRRIPPDVIRIHGITNEHVFDAPTWLELFPRVEEILRGRLVGIYNAEFDLRMFSQSHLAHSQFFPHDLFQNFCIMKLYAKFYGAPASYGSPRWQSLESAGRQCGIPLHNTHRARDDTLLAKAVFDHILRSP
jgi:DNA polymerase III subunit epsilon